MKKSLILVLLLLAGAVSMNAQDVQMGHPTVMKVTGKVVNVGKITSTGAIDLQKTAGGEGKIVNQGQGEIYTNGLIVGAETSIENEGLLCVDCTPGTLPPCPLPLTPGITGKDGSAGNEVYTGDTNLTYEVVSPEDGVTYTWSSADFILPTTKTGTSIQVTAPATAGTKSITVTPSNACGNGTARTLTLTVTATPTNPVGTIVIPNAKTGFISGTYNPSFPTTAKSGDLLLAASDGNSGNQITWNAISGYNSTSYANTNASKFVGSNAGCADGWRLPSIVELKAIADYLNTTYGSYTGTTGTPSGFTALRGSIYWSSTYAGPYTASAGHAWLVIFTNGSTGYYNTSESIYVRCVQDL